MPQMMSPATRAPISAQAQPGRPPDSEFSSLVAAAPTATAAPAWPLVVLVAALVTVWVWVTVLDTVIVSV
jgi:hypothetical protein